MPAERAGRKENRPPAAAASAAAMLQIEWGCAKGGISLKLSAAEYEIMECVWEMGRPVFSADILQMLGAQRGWKAPTVLTFLSRLVEKGLLKTEKHGKTRCYTAAMTREAYKNKETREFLARLYNGSVQNMVVCMANGDGISEEELSGLRAWLEEREEE